MRSADNREPVRGEGAQGDLQLQPSEAAVYAPAPARSQTPVSGGVSVPNSTFSGDDAASIPEGSNSSAEKAPEANNSSPSLPPSSAPVNPTAGMSVTDGNSSGGAKKASESGNPTPVPRPFTSAPVSTSAAAAGGAQLKADVSRAVVAALQPYWKAKQFATKVCVPSKKFVHLGALCRVCSEWKGVSPARAQYRTGGMVRRNVLLFSKEIDVTSRASH